MSSYIRRVGRDYKIRSGLQVAYSTPTGSMPISFVRWNHIMVGLDGSAEIGKGVTAKLGADTFAPATKTVLQERDYFQRYRPTVPGSQVGDAAVFRWRIPVDRDPGTDLKCSAYFVQGLDQPATNKGVRLRYGAVIRRLNQHATIAFDVETVEDTSAATTINAPGDLADGAYAHFFTGFALKDSVFNFQSRDIVYLVIARHSDAAADTYPDTVYLHQIDIGYVTSTL